MPTEPRIAIVIPCFNDGTTLGETVDSALEQEPCEVVVVDDGSTDPETLRVCQQLKERGITVLRQENNGLSAARTTGVKATTARYIYPVDSDDSLVPGSLSALADVLDQAPQRVAAAWGITTAFGDAQLTYRHSATTIDPWRVTHSPGLPYAALFRREALERAGGWSLQGPYEDWDLWLALAEHGYDGYRVPVRVLRYRVHGARMWAEAVARHDDIVSQLRARHPRLFADRRQAWRRSPEGLALRMLFPLVAWLPVSTRTRQRGYLIVEDPYRVRQLITLRAKRILSRRVGG